MPVPVPVLAAAPTLTDGVVTLRAHTDADLDGLLELGSDAETSRWTSVPVPYLRKHAEDWVHAVVPAGWRAGSGFRWALEAIDGGSPRFAGNIDLRTGAGPPPSLGFATAPWARGRGYTARGVRLATRWGFEIAGLPVVHWSAQVGNFASWRVAHACGFAFEGARRLSLPHRNGMRDGWHASLAPADAPSARTIWWPVPVLEGAQVRLRAHLDTDLGRIMQGCADEVARRWLPNLPRLDSVEAARGYVTGLRLGESLGQRVTWAVADRADDRFLAQVGLFRLDDPMCPTGAEIGYWAHPDARGRGVVGEAVRLALAHAFTPLAEGGLGRHRVQLGSAWSNAASRAVAERAGFTRLGRFRQDGLIGAAGGKVYDDGVWYDLLATDPV